MIVLAIFSLILIVLGYLYRTQILEKFSKTTLSLSEGAIVSVIWAMGVGLVLLLLAITWGDVALSRVLVLSGISGATLGWALGMYFSPEGSPESQAFAGIKTAAVGVLSGYVLSKLQRIFDKYIDKEGSPSVGFMLAATYFCLGLLLAGVAVYNVRVYKDLKVAITQSDLDSKSITKDGQIERLMIPAKSGTSIHFKAEARFPDDTSVTWSIDPQNIGEIKSDGSYIPPSEVPKDDPRLAIIATSNADPRVSDRLNAKIVAPTAPTGAVHAQGESGQVGGQHQIGQTPQVSTKKP
jgi:hypothetical protein